MFGVFVGRAGCAGIATDSGTIFGTLGAAMARVNRNGMRQADGGRRSFQTEPQRFAVVEAARKIDRAGIRVGDQKRYAGTGITATSTSAITVESKDIGTLQKDTEYGRARFVDDANQGIFNTVERWLRWVNGERLGTVRIDGDQCRATWRLLNWRALRK